MATIVDTLAGDIEQVSAAVPDYYKFGTQTLLSQFKGSEVLTGNRRAARLPYKQYLGGVQSRVNPNGGALPDGTGPKGAYLSAGWVYGMLSFALTHEQYLAGTKGESAVRINALAEIVANAMEAMVWHDECDLFGSGDGVLTGSATSLATVNSANDSLVFDSSTDYIGVNRLMEGRSVDIWDTTLATIRADGPYQIIAIDVRTKTVTFNAAPTGMAATDRLTVHGLANFTPATPTAGSSTWPAGGETSSTGFTGDSWRHGIPAANASTGYYMTKNRATNPVLKATYVDADSNPISAWHFELAKTGSIQRTNSNEWMQHKWVMHHSNVVQLKQNVTAISNWNRTGGEKMIDTIPTDAYGEFFNVADMQGFSHAMADRSRADSYNPADWVRVEHEPAGWFKNPISGTYLFEDRNASGKQLASWQLRMQTAFDWACKVPGKPMFISGIVPATTPY